MQYTRFIGMVLAGSNWRSGNSRRGSILLLCFQPGRVLFSEEGGGGKDILT